METGKYLIQKQILWAQRNRIPLRSRYEFSRSEPHYTVNLEDNFLRVPERLLRDETALNTGKTAGELQTIHSPRVLAYNVFDYWNRKGEYEPVMNALELSGLKFRTIELNDETGSREDHGTFSAELTIRTQEGFVAVINGTFAKPSFEEYEPCGLEEEYIEDYPFRPDFPHIVNLARENSPCNVMFGGLDGPGLIRKVLELYRETTDKESFMLIHLHDHSLRIDQEINWLEQALSADGVTFKAMSWQQLFMNLKMSTGKDDRDYLDYIMDRYF